MTADTETLPAAGDSGGVSAGVAADGRDADAALARIRRRLVEPLPDDRLWGWVLPLAVAAVAAGLRFWHLSRPGKVVFDEVYYRHDAYNLLHHGVELSTDNSGPGFVVHPPLGKWMIAVGQALFGDTSFGWRFSAAVCGSLAILMMGRIARRLFRSTTLGVVASLLLSLDALEYVQSRVAMLDIFLMFWVLAAFGCLLLDRDAGRRRLADRLVAPLDRDARGPWLGLRPWRYACGFCLGAACSVKWDGVYWVPVFLLFAVLWDAGARRTAGSGRPLTSAILLDGFVALVPFVVVVAAVYVVSWTGWFVSDAAHAYNHDRFVHGQGTVGHALAVLHGWWDYNRQIYHFHDTLDAAHPYLSRPWGWLFLSRPVAYFYEAPKNACGAPSCSQEVLGIGTPLLWWAVIPAMVAVLWRWVSRRDWRASVVLWSFLAGFLPWFKFDADHRTMFLFYMMPAVPFMVLAVTMAIGMGIGARRVSDVRRAIGTAIAGAYVVGVLVNFAYLLPVLDAQPIPYGDWHDRMWLQQCSTQQHRNEHHENAACWI